MVLELAGLHAMKSNIFLGVLHKTLTGEKSRVKSEKKSGKHKKFYAMGPSVYVYRCIDSTIGL